MAARFASNLLSLAAGACLACFALATRPPVAGWIGFAVGVLVLAVTLGAFATRGRGLVQRGLDVVVALLAAWTIVASRVFAAGTELKWLMFSSGAALVVLAIEGLIAHEVVLEMTLRRAAALDVRLDGASAVDQPAPIRVAG
jgi:hypothetical protein